MHAPSNMNFASRERVPRQVWALGFVSLFMDVSSEMIHAILPVYLVAVLGASALAVGFMEGVAEATASITKVFSGVLSDRLGRRKALALAGYGLAALTKPVFALAASVGPVFGARFMDRIGKGIRGAPRDALVADLSPPHLRGASFGLRQALDTVGAVVGPLVAMLLMLLTANAFRTVFWIAVIPAFVSVAILVGAVRDPPRSSTPATAAAHLHDAPRLGLAFWSIVAVAAVLTLARFSEAFLVLRAQDTGVRLALVPGVLVAMNIAYAASAYPAGRLADRLGRRGVLGAGMLLLLAAHLTLAVSGAFAAALGGVMLWGLHMGFTQGVLASLVADHAPPALRGTAFGMFNLVTGMALLAASIIAGALWELHGPAATFLAGAAFTTLAFVGLVLLPKTLDQTARAVVR